MQRVAFGFGFGFGFGALCGFARQAQAQPKKASSHTPFQQLQTRLANVVTAHEDFPKPGIVFRDIFPIFLSPALTRDAHNALLHLIREETGSKIDAVIGLDSRGFLFGPQLAQEFDCAFVPVRKQGKLPGRVVSVSYTKEYGKDSFELQQGVIRPGDNVVIVDDLAATGGSLAASIELVHILEANVVACVVMIELEDLKAREKLPNRPDGSAIPLLSVLKY